MMHPSTKLKLKSPEAGYGVFATSLIPTGTITYIQDELDIVISPEDEILNDPLYKDVLERFSFMNRNEKLVFCWDIAKYVNHCCQCNCMYTGYGFEVAIRDIQAGQEITDEYGLFNFSEEMDLICDHKACREKLKADDINRFHREWDEKIKSALLKFFKVQQPLLKYMDESNYKQLLNYTTTGKNYRSVLLTKNRICHQNVNS